jgi:hypothetical protein
MDNEHEATRAALQADFPAFRISLETTLTGPRYVARSRDLSQNPHTVVTGDPAELRAALAATQPSRAYLALRRELETNPLAG